MSSPYSSAEQSSYHVSRLRRLTTAGAAALGLGLVWELVGRSTTSIAFPSIGAIVRHAPKALSYLIPIHLPYSLFRVLLAYVVGTGLGILAALALYAIPSFGSAFKPWIDLFRSIPGTIAFPFFLGLLGIKGIRGEIAVSMPSLWVVFWITLFSVYRELLVSTSARLQYLREHGASLWFIFRNLHAYVLAKAIFGNARLCVSLALAVLVAMEMYASPNCGLGYYARFEQENNHYEELLVTIILAGGVGWALNKGLEVLEHWLVWW